MRPVELAGKGIRWAIEGHEATLSEGANKLVERPMPSKEEKDGRKQEKIGSHSH